MSVPPVTYLSMDPLGGGVGTSQVVAYVEALARRGLDVTVHSFEPDDADAAVAARLAAAGVRWHPHRFGRAGALGGVGRILRAARAVHGAPLLHARSDLAAAAALIARPRHWVWDVRSFWADQRIELGMLRPGSPEERLLRVVERRSARSADGIVTLSRAAVEVLASRHGRSVTRSAVVIPTCVDLGRFAPAPPPTGTTRLLLSGTLNRYYDVPAMLALHDRLSRRREVELAVLMPAPSPWDDLLRDAGASLASVPPRAMPDHVAASHVGLSVCRRDVGVSARAAVPTKIAEFLAVGRPVVVSPGLGDMDDLVAEHRCGVILDTASRGGADAAAEELDALLDDAELAWRCRAAATASFDLETGVDALVDLYTRL